MRAVVWLVVCGGCSLYFDAPSASHHAVDVDAAVDAPLDAPASCPVPGTSVTIAYPVDGATNVSQPVPIQNTVHRPLDSTEVFEAWLTDATGEQVPLNGFHDAGCSTPIPSSPTDPVVWTECYANLDPGATYTWHIDVECHEPTSDKILSLAAVTFTTAM